jgi:HEAT repeat protein
MCEQYDPTSRFLVDVANDDAPLTGSEFAEANLERLIALTNDEDRSNRDWATFLLAQSDIDTPEARNALIHAAKDDNPDVRAEAIAGLARRDQNLALPLVRTALQAHVAAAGIFEAAAQIGSPLLVEDLRGWSFDNAYLNALVAEALAACEKGSSCSQSAPEG